MLSTFSMNLGSSKASDLSGTIAINQGGTGQTTASAALTALWPSATLNGTTATMNATTGVAGQQFWNTSYNAWFSWVTDRWMLLGPPDPRYGMSLYDEFFGSDRVGTMDWATAAGTISFLTNGSALNPGVVTITQLTASSFGHLRTSLGNLMLGTMDVYLEALIAVPTLATVGEDFCVMFGLNDNAAFDANGACTDGVYFTLNRAVNGVNWITNTTSNTTNTAKNSTTAAVAGTYQRLSIVISAATTVSFYVNGVLATVAHTTNIPTGAGRQTGLQLKIDKIAGTTTGTMNVDYVTVMGFFNGQRVA